MQPVTIDIQVITLGRFVRHLQRAIGKLDGVSRVEVTAPAKSVAACAKPNSVSATGVTPTNDDRARIERIGKTPGFKLLMAEGVFCRFILPQKVDAPAMSGNAALMADNATPSRRTAFANIKSSRLYRASENDAAISLQIST